VGDYFADGQPRLRVECNQGDFLFVNTKLWWHATQLPSTVQFPDGLSTSYARDFTSPSLGIQPEKHGILQEKASKSIRMTNVDGLYASKKVKVGDVVLTEDELPDCALPGRLITRDTANFRFVKTLILFALF
jgi:hypothetical protein